MYATQADIESRYPGELQQAGPWYTDGVIDTGAVALACQEASGLIDSHLKAAPYGFVVPWPAPTPEWITNLAVDIALYQATPTPMASQDDFKDRRRRYEDALAFLAALAAGKVAPPGTNALPSNYRMHVMSRPRVFYRGAL